MLRRKCNATMQTEPCNSIHAQLEGQKILSLQHQLTWQLICRTGPVFPLKRVAVNRIHAVIDRRNCICFCRAYSALSVTAIWRDTI